MSIHYHPSYIDALFERKDILGFDDLILMRGRHRPLPDECRLFQLVGGWLGCSVCGGWQYYESVSEEDYGELCRLLTKFGMTDVLAKCQEGKAAWTGERVTMAVDTWTSEHAAEVEERLLRHLKGASDFLKENEKA